MLATIISGGQAEHDAQAEVPGAHQTGREARVALDPILAVREAP